MSTDISKRLYEGCISAELEYGPTDKEQHLYIEYDDFIVTEGVVIKRATLEQILKDFPKIGEESKEDGQ